MLADLLADHQGGQFPHLFDHGLTLHAGDLLYDRHFRELASPARLFLHLAISLRKWTTRLQPLYVQDRFLDPHRRQISPLFESGRAAPLCHGIAGMELGISNAARVLNRDTLEGYLQADGGGTFIHRFIGIVA